MSRQHGKRKPPARRPRPSAADPPRRRRGEEAPAGDSPPTPSAPSRRRMWVAVGVATLISMISAWALLIALAAAVDRADGEEVATTAITTPLTIGLILVPFAFGALAFISRHPRPSGAVLRAVLLAPIAVIVLFVARDPVAAAVAGLGAGGVVALRPTEAGLRPRVWAVALTTIYTAVLAYVLGAAALTVLPLTFPALVVADGIAQRRAERRMALAAARRA